MIEQFGICVTRQRHLVLSDNTCVSQLVTRSVMKILNPQSSRMDLAFFSSYYFQYEIGNKLINSNNLKSGYKFPRQKPPGQSPQDVWS